ncbi:unnamed protein product [Trichobilharzia regenti]|nr:unnamed protein product [Trichobilharzia regenti]
MLFIFTSLHDFLVHRVETLRIRFSSKWCLPNFSAPNLVNISIPETYRFSDLIQDHNKLLSELQAVCLSTESSLLLRNEIYNLCNMGLQLQDLWIGGNLFLYLNSDSSTFKVKVDMLSNEFDSHVKFLSTMLTRSIRLSNAKQLLYVSSCFQIAASFSSDIFTSKSCCQLFDK